MSADLWRVSKGEKWKWNARTSSSSRFKAERRQLFGPSERKPTSSRHGQVESRSDRSPCTVLMNRSMSN